MISSLFQNYEKNVHQFLKAFFEKHEKKVW